MRRTGRWTIKSVFWRTISVVFTMFPFIIWRWLLAIWACERRSVWLFIIESRFCNVNLLYIILFILFVIFWFLVFAMITFAKLDLFFIIRLIVWFNRSILWIRSSRRSRRNSIRIGRQRSLSWPLWRTLSWLCHAWLFRRALHRLSLTRYSGRSRRTLSQRFLSWRTLWRSLIR